MMMRRKCWWWFEEMRKWVKKQLGFAERDESRKILSTFSFLRLFFGRCIEKPCAIQKREMCYLRVWHEGWRGCGGVRVEKGWSSNIISGFSESREIFYVYSLVPCCIFTAQTSSHKKTIKNENWALRSEKNWREREREKVEWDQNMTTTMAGEWIRVTFNSARIP